MFTAAALQAAALTRHDWARSSEVAARRLENDKGGESGSRDGGGSTRELARSEEAGHDADQPDEEVAQEGSAAAAEGAKAANAKRLRRKAEKGSAADDVVPLRPAGELAS